MMAAGDWHARRPPELQQQHRDAIAGAIRASELQQHHRDAIAGAVGEAPAGEQAGAPPADPGQAPAPRPADGLG
jgi:hypothetical protein